MKSVVICGSKKFKKEIGQFVDKLKELGVFVYEPNFLWLEKWSEEEWSKLSDDIRKFVVMGLAYDHFHKIKSADAVFIFNKDGYIGNSVNMEIGYAVALGKPIYALHNDEELGRSGFYRKIINTPEALAESLGYAVIRPGKKKIVICGSMRFSQVMVYAKEDLERMGFEVVLPKNTELYLEGSDFLKQREASAWEPMEGAKRKIDNNLIKDYYDKIAGADAILVINNEKNDIKNYIGGNTFLEMGFAHILGKKIYCLNPLPEEQSHIYQKLIALQPIIINNDLSNIK